MNLYRYVFNRPTVLRDPMGLESGDMAYDMGFTSVPESMNSTISAEMSAAAAIDAFATGGAAIATVAAAAIAAPDAAIACALNPQVCASFTGGVLQGLLRENTGGGTGNSAEMLAELLGTKLGEKVKSACSGKEAK